MLPSKELNIYPKNEENIKAIFSYYFDKHNLNYGDNIEEIYTIKNISLNQIEFIAKMISESYETIFKVELSPIGCTISNLMRYGIDGLTKEEKDWSFGPYSSGRAIVKKFIDFVRDTKRS